MRRVLVAIVIGVLFGVCGGGVAMAAKSLSQAEAEQLIKGNTVEGVNRWNKQMTWYFDPSGELRKRDHLGNKGKAKWNIDKKGQLCYQDKHDKNEICGAIVPQGEGAYDVEIPGAWKWKKITPGNPNNL